MVADAVEPHLAADRRHAVQVVEGLVQLQQVRHGVFFQVKVVAFACIVVDPDVQLFEQYLQCCEEQLTADDRPQEHILLGLEESGYILNDLLTGVGVVQVG